MAPNTPKVIFLTEIQIQALCNIVQMRINELTLSNENPSTIDMYRDALGQLKKG